MRRFVLFVGILWLSLSSIYAEEIISLIKIEGNKRISDAKIIPHIKVRAQQPYNENVINDDVKTLFGLGYFENIEVEKIKTPQGVEVIFNIREKPVLKKINIEKTRYIHKNKIKDTLESMDVKEDVFFDEFNVKKALGKVEDLYRRKGFSQAEISYKAEVIQDTNEAALTVFIDEKGVVRVKKIAIKGNETFTEKHIKKMMKTKERGLIKRGVFKEAVLEDDIERIRDFYIEKGFSGVEIDTIWDYLDNEAYITIKINEGVRYNIGKIDISGNEVVSTAALRALVSLKESNVYIKSEVERQGLEIQSFYFDKGYIFAQVRPLSYLNPETQGVDITFQIAENELNYVEMIHIKGNQKTKDKIVRREMRIYPGDKFEGEKIKKSRQRLENLGFFEEIRFDTEPGSKLNWQNLIVDVKETKTGYLSFGGGYSSIDEFVGFLELRQRNFDYKNWKTFTGAGQDLSLYASFGSLTESYEINFTNPYVFDSPYYFGFDAYKRQHEREEDVGYGYNIDTRGGTLRTGREFGDNFKAGAAYKFERVEISDVVEDATQELKDEVGANDLSTAEFTASWDSRDNVFNPYQGIFFSNTFQLTGGLLGGDKDFMKFSSHFSIYFSFLKQSVLEYKLRAGFAESFLDTEKVPIYERFFAGGANTIRGYHERKIGPIDSVTEDPIGGETFFITNIEYTYPLIDFLKVAAFFDSGNVWKERGDFLSGGLKSSIGMGLRIKTPLGPIKLDYGWPLNTEPGEEGKEGRFHFSISRGF